MKTYSFKDIDEDDIPVVAAAMVQENNVEQLRALRKHIQKEIVRTHMDLQLMDHLVLSLYRGIFPRLDVSQAIALPNLQ